MADFYLNSVDGTSVEAIHFGNSGSLTRWVGKLVGGAIDLAVFFVTLPIRFIRAVGALLDPSNVVTKYYDIKTAMPLYYKHVDTIITTLAINMGLYPNAYYESIDNTTTQTQGTQNKEGLVAKYTGKHGQADYTVKETRIHIRLNDELAKKIDKSKVYHIAMHCDDLSKYASITFAPNITKDMLNKILKDNKAIEEIYLKNSRVQLSEYNGSVYFNLKDKLCDNCNKCFIKTL